MPEHPSLLPRDLALWNRGRACIANDPDRLGLGATGMMRFTDLDWRAIMNDFSDADLIYLKSIIDEKLGHRAKRKALIRKEE